METTTPTYSNNVEEERKSSNYTTVSKNSQLMQGGDRAWGGRDKRLNDAFVPFFWLILFSIFKRFWPNFLHLILFSISGLPCLRRWAKFRRVLHRPRSQFLIMSSSSGSEQLFYPHMQHPTRAWLCFSMTRRHEKKNTRQDKIGCNRTGQEKNRTEKDRMGKDETEKDGKGRDITWSSFQTDNVIVVNWRCILPQAPFKDHECPSTLTIQAEGP